MAFVCHAIVTDHIAILRLRTGANLNWHWDALVDFLAWEAAIPVVPLGLAWAIMVWDNWGNIGNKGLQWFHLFDDAALLPWAMPLTVITLKGINGIVHPFYFSLGVLFLIGNALFFGRIISEHSKLELKKKHVPNETKIKHSVTAMVIAIASLVFCGYARLTI